MITPKEKAKELVEKYWSIGSQDDCDTILNWEEAKIAAIIAVDEILWEIIKYSDNSKDFVVENSNYWQQVKTEIENL